MRLVFVSGISGARLFEGAVALGVAAVLLAADVLPVGSAPPDTFAVTREAKGSDDFRPDRFTFSAGGFQYSVKADGTGVRSAQGGTSQRFRLPVDSDKWIERLWYLPIERDIVLICEDSDGESGGGIVVRLAGQRLQRRWVAKLPGFNIGEGLLDGAYLYVTAIGFVGKLDLNAGKFAWAHENLYQNPYGDGRFSAFKRPILRDDVVVFTDGTNTIVVDKQSGKHTP